MINLRNLCLVAASSIVLAACSTGGNVKETLGLSRKAPDEFRVYARPPLTIPPEFALRPPGTATDAQTMVPAHVQAQEAVLESGNEPAKPKKKKSAAATASSADTQFLKRAGAEGATSNVRAAIEGEKDMDIAVKDDRYLLNPAAGSEPIVDAKKEADRLKQNKAAGKAATEGETPVVQSKEKGILGSLGDLF